ncbi:MAG: glycerophosphodiester phosphodiesterase [Bacteroidota bacterium]|nr:glycerophosphodiester phosphodiesterase [Bacteroidota bacterium]
MRRTKIIFTLQLCLFAACVSTKKIHMDLPAFDAEAHRGGRGLMPENTIPAMLHALGLPAVTTLEMDAVITKDQQVLVSHEPFFNHDISTKPDGSFITEKEERDYNIYRMTYAETQQFDVGSKPHPRFLQQQKMAVHKPLLGELIDSVEAKTKTTGRPPVFYNIETKSNPATDNVFHPGPELFVDLLMKVIMERKIKERVIIQSFDPRTLQIIHRRYPSVKTSLLIEGFDKRGIAAQLQQLGFVPTVYSPAHELVTPELIQACHAQNIKIVPWTVNTRERIQGLKTMGVDGVISDYPNLF